MRFTQAIEMRKNGLLQKINNKWWIIQEEFIWYVDFEDKIESVIVPKGFITNFWSIPKFMRWFIDYTSLSYILHDYLYSEFWKIILIWSDLKVSCIRSYADMVLRDALKVEWIWFIKRWMVWIGVRLFWWMFYKK